MLAVRTVSCSGAFTSRTAAVRPVVARPAVPARGALVIRSSYQNRENVDLSKVAAQKRHETDTGSSEVQIARLTARIVQLAAHLKGNRKDHSANRGLQAILNTRKSLLQYLYSQDRDTYFQVVKTFNIRSVMVGDTRGAARKEDDLKKTSMPATA